MNSVSTQVTDDMTAEKHFRLGVDIGGTFTDFALLDEGSGELTVLKVPSRGDRPSAAVVSGITTLLSQGALTSSNLDVFVHGTTLGVNTIIERSGASAGLLVTSGFRDILSIARQRIEDIYNFFTELPPPLIPRQRVAEINERTTADGSILREPDPEEVTAAVAHLLEEGVEAIAISFLHSYRNPRCEQLALEAIQSKFPDLYVSVSSQVWPQMREYERTLAAVINAYAGPKLSGYFELLQEDFAEIELDVPILSTRSNGGIMSAKRAGLSPIETVLSGPASGVIGAAYLGAIAGVDKLVTLDMGGTSADVGVVEGQPRLTTDSFIGDFPIILPAVDVAAIGAGGGSIAWTDPDGVLKVGPRSAGSRPGPACYGLGGEEPTVTDAYVTLGVLDPSKFLGGAMVLQPELAGAALTRLGDSLGLTAQETAEAVLNVATAQMYAALVPLMARKAVDIAEFTLMPYGGAGPTHAFILAQETGIKRVLVPASPGVMCALGCLTGDVRSDFIRSVHMPLVDDFDSTPDVDRLRDIFDVLERDARVWLDEQQIPVSGVTIAREADMRYVGQSFEITVTLDDGILVADSGRQLSQAFHGVYSGMYGYTDQAADLEIVNVRLSITGYTPKPAAGGGEQPTRRTAQPSSFRDIRWNGRSQAAGIYERSELQPGMTIKSPAIIEQYDTTVFVPEGFATEVDRWGNLVAVSEDATENAEANDAR
jgi:N-methylhydantoinase A